MTRSGHYLAAAVLIICTAGCDESLTDFAGPTPNLEPTFSSIQQNIFNTTDSAGRSACITCHNTTNVAISGGLNLTGAGAYNALVNAASVGKAGAIRVIPGDPAGSYLIQKLEGASGIVGERMPQDGPPFLTVGQIAIIRQWIQDGAPNN